METVTECIINQECDGQLLNVYRGADNYGLKVGQKINDPSEHHIEGQPHTTLKRVQ